MANTMLTTNDTQDDAHAQSQAVGTLGEGGAIQALQTEVSILPANSDI